MIYAVIILSMTLIYVIISYVLYRRQIADFCRQLAFIQNFETNKLLTQSLDNRELTELTKAMNDIIERYKEIVIETKHKDDRLRAAITNVSHDIRTPLTSLDGYFQLLLSTEDEAERQRYCAIIRERIDSLSGILEELFIYTKLQNDAYNLELDRVDVGKILSDTLLSFYDDIVSSRIEPKISIPDSCAPVFGNDVALKRVFQNIIKNAIAHGTDFLDVTMTLTAESVRIRFSNRYAGEEGDVDVAQVFDRFYKADSSRSSKTTGLGLSIAKELVMRMDGEISAEYVKKIFSVEVSLQMLSV